MPRGRSSRNSSQLSQSQVLTPSVNIDDQINNTVRYFVNNSGQNVFFRRVDLQKHCIPKSGQNFQMVMERAMEILKNVYGLNLIHSDQGDKGYIVSNAMPSMNYNNGRASEADNLKILLLLVLSHIFMSNSSVTEASLFSFLKSLNIDVDVRHPLFGHSKDYIMTTLVKQKYLALETDPVSKKISLSWGTRSEKEISKKEILKFVCKMFNERQPKSWTSQYQEAQEQDFNNERFQDVRN